MGGLDMQPQVPYLPECSGLTEADFWSDFGGRGAKFDLTQPKAYLFDEVVPTVIPGVVLGIIALLCFLGFLCWALVSCCCACCSLACCPRCCRRRAAAAAPPPRDPSASRQFIAAVDSKKEAAFIYDASRGSGSFVFGQPAAAPPPAQRRRGCRGLLTWRAAFWAAFLGLGLATIGVAAWGMAESIELTNSTVSDFWNLVGGVQRRVDNSTAALAELQEQTDRLRGASTVLSTYQPAVETSLASLGVPQAADIASALAQAPRYLAYAPEYIGKALAFLDSNINNALLDIRAQFEPPTMSIEDKWRFLPITIILGLTILMVLAVLPLVYYAMRLPRWAVTLVALLWLCITLLMFVGVAVLKGVHTVASDACLFGESFALSYARKHTAGTLWGPSVIGMLQFYFDPTDQAEQAAFELDAVAIAREVANRTNSTAELAGVLDAIQSEPVLASVLPFLPTNASLAVSDVYGLADMLFSGVRQLAGLLGDPQLEAKIEEQALRVGVPPVASRDLAAALGTTGRSLEQVLLSVNKLAYNLEKRNVQRLYHSTKTYICCTLNSSVWDLWVAWTATGCLALALALAASGRLMYATWRRRKAAKAGQELPLGAAALWHDDGGSGGGAAGAGLGKAASIPVSKAAAYQAPAQEQFAVSPRIEAVHNAPLGTYARV